MLINKRNKVLGFTAIEIAMVATVIAILALIVLPLFRKRTDEAKIVAAKDDLRSLRDALVMANAYTDQWFRLQDLDNGQTYNEPPLNPDTEVPIAYWNREITVFERSQLTMGHSDKRWTGPYASLPRSAYLGELNPNFVLPPQYQANARYNYRPELFRSNNGPILDLIGRDSPLDKIPVDPWGNPYIFFAPGKIGISPATETDYSNAVIYSLGPNGVPGNVQTTNPYYYLREAGYLGLGDDLYISF